jgi:hypothetical protein
MKKISLNISRASASELATKATTVVSKMTGNTTFPAPSPALNSITAQVNLLNAKLTEQSAALRTYQQKSAEVQAEKKQLYLLLQTQATYVQLTSGGDEIKILSAGFDVKDNPSPIGTLEAPKKVLANAGGSDGEIEVTFNQVYGAKSYVIEVSYDVNNPEAWDIHTIVTRTKAKLANLESGKRIWVRVAAVNTSGRGAYSDPATKTIP